MLAGAASAAARAAAKAGLTVGVEHCVDRRCPAPAAPFDRRCPAPPETPVDAFLGFARTAAAKWLGQPPPPLAQEKPKQPPPTARARRGSSKEGQSEAPSRAPLDLKTLNPSLFAIGLDTVERIMPRYLTKAGIACERMQHAHLPVEAIRRVLDALFVVPEGETEQSESALRDVFSLVDASGDGSLDQDEFLAVLPLLGEDVPPEAVTKLFEAADVDNGGTMDGGEFVSFIRAANPADPAAPDGWRAFLPETAAHFEEMILLQLAERRRAGGTSGADGRGAPKMWRVLHPSELAAMQRASDEPWATTLVLARQDLANAEAVVAGLRGLGFADQEVRVVVRALFVSDSDEDYAKVFAIFDRDSTGGIDPFEFRAIMALLGEHSTEAEARELFLDADADNDGVLDVSEFVGLLRRVSPKATSAADARQLSSELARERLQARIGKSDLAIVDPAAADAVMQILVLGASKAGKTFLLNQILADKLPKGYTVAVGVGALPLRFGQHTLALQVLDTPGDARFAPLGRIFYPSVHYALLLFDATSFESFEQLGPLYDAFLDANPNLEPAAHVALVANMARVGVKRAVSSGYALEWCRQRGGIPLFEVEAEAPQGILEPLHHLADEFLTANPISAPPRGRQSDDSPAAASDEPAPWLSPADPPTMVRGVPQRKSSLAEGSPVRKSRVGFA